VDKENPQVNERPGAQKATESINVASSQSNNSIIGATTLQRKQSHPSFASNSTKLWAVLIRSLFGNPLKIISTLVGLGICILLIPPFIEWGIVSAVFSADPVACQEARGIGACWGVIVEKYPLILWGRFPYAQQWRPQLSTALLLVLIVRSSLNRVTFTQLCAEWFCILGLIFVLMSGYLGPLEFLRNSVLTPLFGQPFTVVSTDLWGGLPLTLMLSFVCIVLASPLAVFLALGRQSQLPIFSVLSKTYIELLRGVPLISVLFMASYMFPLLLPSGYSPDVLIRVVLGISLFAAAYLAEIVRAGLQAIPKGQLEAADSLGLGYWQTQYLVVLPQALKIVIPGMMNSFIAIFKDTSLITIVSLYELTGSLSLALNGDALWRPFKLEGYLFITLIYFVFCFSMSRYSLWLEKRLNHS
jgi:general L-amino acid transport system permease protein